MCDNIEFVYGKGELLCGNIPMLYTKFANFRKPLD